MSIKVGFDEVGSMEIVDTDNGYDYRHQAYVKDGKYVRCGHGLPCDCYGTKHEGEPAAADADIH